MAYIPTEWETGDVITAVKLNKIEAALAFAYPVIARFTVEYSDLVPGTTAYGSCDRTFAELHEALSAHRPVNAYIDILSEDVVVLSAILTPTSPGGDDQNVQFSTFALDGTVTVSLADTETVTILVPGAA